MTNDDEFEKALRRLEDTGEFSEDIIPLAHSALAKGNTRAMCFLGLYALREDTQSAIAHATRLFEKAAAAGDTDGSFFLGMMQWKTEGMRDLKSAVSNLRIAVNDENPDAQLQLGLLLISEPEYKDRRSDASILFKRAADNGDPAAQYFFALDCLRGEGIPKNATMGLRYLRYSADAGCVQAKDMLRKASE